MSSSLSLGLMHQITSLLLEPVVWALLCILALTLFEVGLAIAERLWAIQAADNPTQLMAAGRKRIERADFITRISPMLGLMGTLIPLGPGLSALGEGELSILTTAITVAFDTTVVGLLAGMVGFVLGRLRRRWYDTRLEQLERSASGCQAHG